MIIYDTRSGLALGSSPQQSSILGPWPAYYSHPQSMRQLTTYDNSQFLNPYMFHVRFARIIWTILCKQIKIMYSWLNFLSKYLVLFVFKNIFNWDDYRPFTESKKHFKIVYSRHKISSSATIAS